MGGGILPVAIHKNKLYFLFGLENNMDDTPGWADFGGGRKGSETHFETATREGAEELNGFFGSISEVRKLVKKKLILQIKLDTYHTYVFKTDYDDKLPFYFNNNFRFSQKNLPNIIKDTENGLLEKQKIKWFTLDQVKKEKNFRPFYQNIIDKLIKEIPKIKNKTRKHKKYQNKTKKRNN
jgi:8-oxo-dGTP pyrophosphatase MutT (NUDIX family)